MGRFKITPATVTQSSMSYYYPPTMKDDFSNFINTDIPNGTYTFEQVHDWYERSKEDYKPVYIRGLYFPINWKSKIGNSDASSNFKTDFTEIIYKGDILIRQPVATCEDTEEEPEDESTYPIYIANWKVHNNLNNQATQVIDYNFMQSVERLIPRQLDDNGMVVQEEHIETVCPDIPAVINLYAGRPDYTVSYNSPGITPDHLTNGQVQFNPTTNNIHIGDEFDWYDYRYRIIDVYHSEVDPITNTGLLNFNARRVAGSFSDE